MTGTTLRVSRVIRAPREVVYRAFLDADAFARWYPPHGLVGRVHAMDARTGGRYRMSIATLDRSWSLAFGGVYEELAPFERIVLTNVPDTDDPELRGAMRITVAFASVEGGTRVDVLHEGIPPGGARGAPEGWRQSLENLARLAEASVASAE